MKFGKKVVVAVDLGTSVIEQLQCLKQLEFLQHADVHLVHVYKTIFYSYSVGLGDVNLIYPVENDRIAIEESVLSLLKKGTQELFPKESESKVHQHCLFADKPKVKLTNFAEEIKADTIVVLSRQKHGIFESSFAQYVNAHSKCHVVCLKLP